MTHSGRTKQQFIEQQNSQFTVIDPTILGHLFSNSIDCPVRAPEQSTLHSRDSVTKTKTILLNSQTSVSGPKPLEERQMECMALINRHESTGLGV
jgi:hypothetical protein